MTAADFGRFYKAIHGHEPFPWQARLLEQVLLEGWPQTISLPTSSGKTSAIDVAVFHLALEAGKSALERKAPLRVFFVIDRRVVVDEAAEHALKLARGLLDSSDEIVKSVASALRGFDAKYPLDVAVLRGGVCLDSSWIDEPNQPIVCVSTVDQIGSRLLFRGYQVSEEARPVHAGLVGNDSLIIVDEAHLSNAFLETLGEVEQIQKNGSTHSRPARGIDIVKMSATIGHGETQFQLRDADYENRELRKRLEASKPTALRAPVKGFEDELVRAAKELALMPDVFVVGVVVNTVAVARAVFEDLKKLKAGEAILLTGRNRPYHSKRLWEEYKDRIAAKPDRATGNLLFVVATQTVEVGANLDFDALVTEAAPLDALRQRFGRLNRLGNRPEAHAIIVLRPKGDVVYGTATAKTWELLNQLEKVDFGVRAMNEAMERHDLEGVNTTRSRAPLVFSKYLEMWSHTNPAPSPDAVVAPFLHGPDALDESDVQMIWREDLAEDGDSEAWQEAVELAPPVSTEALALPLGALRRWLSGATKQEVADVEGLPAPDDDIRKNQRRVLIWRGAKSGTPITDASKLRPGDVVIMPASYGGCDKFGWYPQSDEAVDDIGDLANNEMAANGLRKYRVRLDLVAKSLKGDAAEEFRRLRDSLEDNEEHDPAPELSEKLATFLPSFPGNPRIDTSVRLATWPKGKRDSKLIGDGAPAEETEDYSSGLERKISLSKHTAGVVEQVRRYASGCGLGADFVKDLVLAALLHDLGKWDERFQAWLCGGSIVRAMKEKEPLAKSGGRLSLAELRQSRESARYPLGARHEAASVLLAPASGELANATDSDLVLHLIGTHHGYGRPLLPHWEEDDHVSVIAEYDGKEIESGTGRELARFGSGWPDRFVQMNQRYGYWGLAYLEAILRRADCMQSRKEQGDE